MWKTRTALFSRASVILAAEPTSKVQSARKIRFKGNFLFCTGLSTVNHRMGVEVPQEYKTAMDMLHAVTRTLGHAGWLVGEPRAISYGLQAEVGNGEQKFTIRIYAGKKGVKLDLSQVRPPALRTKIENILGQEAAPPKDADADLSMPELPSLIGVDESGKGDYFGPLVIAGAHVRREDVADLHKLKVRDSKSLTDPQIVSIAARLKKRLEFSVVAINNVRYNELYAKIGNLNQLLGWGHARVIENLLEKVDCDTVLSDKFAHEFMIKRNLMQRGRKITLRQEVRAERNVAVAAASILARAAYVEHMAALEKEFGMALPKGASGKVIKAAQELVKRHGSSALGKVAKLHFKSTQKVLG